MKLRHIPIAKGFRSSMELLGRSLRTRRLGWSQSGSMSSGRYPVTSRLKRRS
nr:hypothetical protein [Thermococcus sp.]